MKRRKKDMEHDFTLFKAYPLKPGQKIKIEGGSRSGDWEVAEVTDNKVTLKCPVSGKQFSWARFCYFVEDQHGVWPDHEE